MFKSLGCVTRTHERGGRGQAWSGIEGVTGAVGEQSKRGREGGREGEGREGGREGGGEGERERAREGGREGERGQREREREPDSVGRPGLAAAVAHAFSRACITNPVLRVYVSLV
jgi:hypothetical protein